MIDVLTLVRSMTIGNNGSDSPLEHWLNIAKQFSRRLVMQSNMMVRLHPSFPMMVKRLARLCPKQNKLPCGSDCHIK